MLIYGCTSRKPIYIGNEIKNMRVYVNGRISNAKSFSIDDTLAIYVEDYPLAGQNVHRLYFFDELGFPVYYQRTDCEIRGDKVYVFSMGTGKSSYEYSVSNAKIPSLNGERFTFFLRDDYEVQMELDDSWKRQVYQWLVYRNSIYREKIEKWNKKHPEDPVKPDLDEE
ncbi:MAG: hypothetical protein KF836_11950 [Fimbriimonadaceae bacterium]|nr:hypothetical protein [Fimbriimonadaceae bacterium]